MNGTRSAIASSRQQAGNRTSRLACRLAGASLAAITVAAASAAWAQSSAPSPTAGADTGAGPDRLSEVVVTARRKAENLQTVPLSIVALSQKDLSAAGARSLQDVTFLTPGLTYSSNGQEANAAPVIRGLSDTSGGEATSSNVSIFLDGIYIANPSAIDLALGGLDRVEIVKGPVSGLYGRNAFTGAINYVTAKPTKDYHLDLSGTVGDSDRTILSGIASGPILGDVLTGRIAYTYDHLGGTYTDPVSGLNSNGHNRNDVLGSLQFTPDKHIAVNAVAYFGEDQFNAPTIVSYAQNCALGTSNSYCGNANENQRGPFTPASDGSQGTGLTRRTEHVHVDSKFSYDVGTFDVLFGFNHIATKTINEFTGTENGLSYDLYRPGANNSFASPPTYGAVLANSFFGDQAVEKDSSVELRYDTPAQYPIRFGVGGYYYRRVSTNNNTFGIDGRNIPAGFVLNAISQGYVTTNGASAAPLNFAKSGVRDYSEFVSAEWDILPKLTLSTAVRETEEQQTQEGTASTSFLSKNFHSLTSNEALTWKPDRRYTFYVSAANGEKSGGFNGGATGPADLTFNPETDWNYEGGVKTQLFDGRLRVDAAIFHTDVDDLQVIGPPATAGAIALVVKNFGSLSATGGEISADWVVGHGLKLSSGVSYSEPRFTSDSYDFNGAASCALIASCASSRLVTINGVKAVKLDGLRPPFSSDATFNFSTEYRRPLGFSLPHMGELDWYARGDYRFESRQYTTVDNFSYYGPRNVLNLHLGVENKSWTAEVFALNVTNDLTPVTLQFNGSLNGFDPPPNGFFGVTWVPVAALPEGRTFAFKLAYHY